MKWSDFTKESPELAAVAEELFATKRVAYIATVTSSGGPRVHPVTPFVDGGRLLLFMEPSSPKGRDLLRDGRFALHTAVDGEAGGGEMWMRGIATVVDDQAVRALAVGAAGYEVLDPYVLFELSVDRAMGTTYGDETVRTRWPV